MLKPTKPILTVCLGLASALAAHTLAPATTVLADSTSVRRGGELFAENGCAHCHGTNGVGGGKGPDLKNVAHRMKAKEMAAQIHDGGKNMPPYGDALKDQQIADLVEFLHSKRKAALQPIR